jgi:predicted glycosyltransferase involved in capsule biosynthesis
MKYHGYTNTISFCTVVLNRIENLKKTLPHNLSVIKFIENAKIILIDYGSTDGVDEYIRNSMSDYIENGKLVFYKTVDTKDRYWHAHCKNISHTLSDSDIVSCCDGDSYLTTEYVNFVMKNISENVVVDAMTSYGLTGYISLMKKDFDRIGGYDEEYTVYGSEDIDIVKRCKMIGMKNIRCPAYYLKTEKHGDSDRTKNQKVTDIGKSLRISQKQYNDSLLMNKIVANERGIVGETLIKNFKEIVKI